MDNASINTKFRKEHEKYDYTFNYFNYFLYGLSFIYKMREEEK